MPTLQPRALGFLNPIVFIDSPYNYYLTPHKCAEHVACPVLLLVIQNLCITLSLIPVAQTFLQLQVGNKYHSLDQEVRHIQLTVFILVTCHRAVEND